MGTLASTWKDIWTVWNIWEFSPEHMRFWSRHQGLESLLLESLHSPSHCFGTRLHPLSLLPSSFWNLLRKLVHPVHPVHNPKLHFKIGPPLLLLKESESKNLGIMFQTCERRDTHTLLTSDSKQKDLVAKEGFELKALLFQICRNPGAC